MDEKELIFRYGLLNGTILGVVITGSIIAISLYYKEVVEPYFKNRKKKKNLNLRKNLPTYSNNLIQFPIKKQG
jgi:orotate phosphoribosyltransferase